MFDQLDIRELPREEFVQKYSRKVIMRGMAADVLAHLEPKAITGTRTGGTERHVGAP